MLVMKALKKQIKSLLEVFGYRLFRIDSLRPVDVRQGNNNPKQFFYYGGRPVLIDAPTTLGRIRFFSLSKECNPFVYAVSVALNEVDTLNTIESVLHKYYSLVKPENAHDWLGLNAKDAPLLSEVPVWSVPEPWKLADIGQKRSSIQNVAINESRQTGHALDISHGEKCFGPVTKEKLSIETTRLHNVMLSIQHNGWQRHDGYDGDIEAVVFMRDECRWCWQVSRGLHRVAVLSALGWQNIPLRVNAIVWRSDADIWPNVVSGLYTKIGALKLFDRISDGALPPIVQPWTEEVQRMTKKPNK